jgi:hypothetical protein
MIELQNEFLLKFYQKNRRIEEKIIGDRDES